MVCLAGLNFKFFTRPFSYVPDILIIWVFFKFPTKKPIKVLGHGAFRYDAHGDEKQKTFLAKQTMEDAYVDVRHPSAIYINYFVMHPSIHAHF